MFSGARKLSVRGSLSPHRKSIGPVEEDKYNDNTFRIAVTNFENKLLELFPNLGES